MKAMNNIVKASKAWAEDFAAQTNLPNDKASIALSIFVLNAEIVVFLAENDPKALAQAQRALNGKDYTTFYD